MIKLKSILLEQAGFGTSLIDDILNAAIQKDEDGTPPNPELVRGKFQTLTALVRDALKQGESQLVKNADNKFRAMIQKLKNAGRTFTDLEINEIVWGMINEHIINKNLIKLYSGVFPRAFDEYINKYHRVSGFSEDDIPYYGKKLFGKYWDAHANPKFYGTSLEQIIDKFVSTH